LLLHPVIAESGFAGLGAAVSGSTVADDFPAPTGVCADLLQRFAQVSDGRRDQGRSHPVAVVLALCAAAVVAGMASFTAIAGWATDVPAEVLVKLYGRRSDPPSKATIWRVVTGADAATVDAVIGAWLLAQAAARDTAARDTAARDTAARDTAARDTAAREVVAGEVVAGEVVAGEVVAGEVVAPGNDREAPELLAIMVDGKAVRGATDAEGNQTHLLAAATHDDALVVGQVEVGAKSNEIPQFAPLLDTLAAAGVDLAHTVITADALHTQRAHADYLHERGAGFVFTCKHNQPRLFAALDALPWAQTPIAARQVDRGHGRVTTRTIQVMPAPADLPFPHVNQVWLIERYVTALDGTPSSAVAALGVTNLTAHTTTPQHLAALVRNHWGIESLHWLRDTVYREDNSTVRTSSGPRVMAGLRNLAVGAHHLAGRRDITEASREAGRVMHRPFKILKLT
jgi:predicted transposase YbfD/YdcC